MNQQTFYPVTEKSQVGEARRRLTLMAEQLGFDSIAREKVAIVVTELATNLLKHAGEGELVARRLVSARNPAQEGIELLSLDRGPGMANVVACLRDGYSTTGSLGQGLGAIQRQSTTFDLYSAPGLGTALLAQLWAHTPAPPDFPFTHGLVCRPKAGEIMNGDGWSAQWHERGYTLLLSDGLGHGPEAAAATQHAVQAFMSKSTRTALALAEAIHGALRPTRGAAVAVVEVLDNVLHFVGIGNISGRVWDGAEARHLLSQNGIAGHQARKIQDFPQTWGNDPLLILHSDGLGTRWALERYPGLRYRHPALIAGVLYRDFMRSTDDVTVFVVKGSRRQARQETGAVDE